MSKIKKTDTKPELLVRKYLFSKGFRYRLYNKNLPGNPDIILPKHKTIVFVNGCFWHAHVDCRYNRMPKTRIEYWVPKIEGNARRDEVNKQKLEELGWKVLIVWECELKRNMIDKTLGALEDAIKFS